MREPRVGDRVHFTVDDGGPIPPGRYTAILEHTSVDTDGRFSFRLGYASLESDDDPVDRQPVWKQLSVGWERSKDRP